MRGLVVKPGPTRPPWHFVALGAAALVLLAAGSLVLLMRSGDAAPPAPAEAPLLQAAPEAKKVAREVDAAAPPAEAAADVLREEAGLPRRAPLVVEHLGAKRVSCTAACALEEQCGFRSRVECAQGSCEGELRRLSRSDFQLEGATDCAALAELPCEEACWKQGECTGHHEGDAQCTAACRTLVRQAPRETFREKRCVLERPCVDLPLCAESG